MKTKKLHDCVDKQMSRHALGVTILADAKDAPLILLLRTACWIMTFFVEFKGLNLESTCTNNYVWRYWKELKSVLLAFIIRLCATFRK